MSKHATTAPDLTQERLRELLDYDPETGFFTWVTRRNGIHVGQTAGHVNNHGYVQIRIDGRSYQAHRLAWLWMVGALPTDHVDHINRDRADNRWGNLRLASRSQNMGNRSISRNNTSGVKGVIWHKDAGKWMACIKINGKRRYLGYFLDIDAAAAAYADAARQHFGEYAHAAIA